MARSGGLRTFVTRSILLLARKLADYSMPAERLGEIARVPSFFSLYARA